MNLGLFVATPLQADDIDPLENREMAANDTEGNDVGANTAKSDNHRAFADSHKLPHCRMAAEDRETAHADVPAQHHIVSERHIAADPTIMTHVRSDHEKTAVSDFGDPTVIFGSRVHGDCF